VEEHGKDETIKENDKNKEQGQQNQAIYFDTFIFK
jgi:hypothetical protein